MLVLVIFTLLLLLHKVDEHIYVRRYNKSRDEYLNNRKGGNYA
jgi:hypothetical protein